MKPLPPAGVAVLGVGVLVAVYAMMESSPTVPTGLGSEPNTVPEADDPQDTPDATLPPATPPAPTVGVSTSPVGSTTPSAPHREAFTYRQATYNINKGTTAAQTKADLAKLIPNHDVITLQEWTHGRHAAVVPWLRSQGWGFYLPRGDAPIIWNRAKFRRVGGGAIALNKPRMVEAKTSNRLTRHWSTQYATWARFRDKATGTVFTVVSVHTIPNVIEGDKPVREKVKREQFRTLAKATLRLSKLGPLFVGGDLNLDPHRAYWPKVLLTVAHLRSNWDWLGESKFGKGTLGAHFVDNILSPVGGRVTALSENIVRGLNSDHDAASVTYQVRG